MNKTISKSGLCHPICFVFLSFLTAYSNTYILLINRRYDVGKSVYFEIHIFCVFSSIESMQLYFWNCSIYVWYILKDNSISRSMRGWSWSYDNCEGYTGWLTDIPPQSKSHKLYVIWVYSQCVPVLLWVVFTQRLIGAWSRSTRLDI